MARQIGTKTPFVESISSDKYAHRYFAGFKSKFIASTGLVSHDERANVCLLTGACALTQEKYPESSLLFPTIMFIENVL